MRGTSPGNSSGRRGNAGEARPWTREPSDGATCVNLGAIETAARPYYSVCRPALIGPKPRSHPLVVAENQDQGAADPGQPASVIGPKTDEERARQGGHDRRGEYKLPGPDDVGVQRAVLAELLLKLLAKIS